MFVSGQYDIYAKQIKQILGRSALLPSFFLPTAESFGVSAQIGCGLVRGGPGFHQGSTRVPPRGFHEVLRGLRGLLGISLSLFFFLGGLPLLK